MSVKVPPRSIANDQRLLTRLIKQKGPRASIAFFRPDDLRPRKGAEP
jgi:hypothetical protein